MSLVTICSACISSMEVTRVILFTVLCYWKDVEVASSCLQDTSPLLSLSSLMTNWTFEKKKCSFVDLTLVLMCSTASEQCWFYHSSGNWRNGSPGRHLICLSDHLLSSHDHSATMWKHKALSHHGSVHKLARFHAKIWIKNDAEHNFMCTDHQCSLYTIHQWPRSVLYTMWSEQ